MIFGTCMKKEVMTIRNANSHNNIIIDQPVCLHDAYSILVEAI